MLPSKYQENIYKEYRSSLSNLCIKAAPGSGKTTTLLELLKITAPYKKVLFLAFNKSIVDELSSRIKQDNVRVNTLHSIGFSVLRNRFKNISFKVNETNNWKDIDKFIKTKKEFKDNKAKNSYIYTILELVNLYRMNLCKSLEEAFNISFEYNVTTLNNEVETAWEFMERILIPRYNSLLKLSNCSFGIDFVDMLYIPYLLVGKYDFYKYDVVMIDESQDLNSIQKELMLRFIKDSGKFVAVGDEFQAIYSFMGSNKKSFENLQKLPGTKVLPLSVSYRCGKKIIEEANYIFNNVEHFEENGDGVVRNGNVSEIEEGDFVLCRNNLPLIQCYIELLRRKKKSFIMGKDLEKTLIRFIESCEGEDINQYMKNKTLEKYEKLKEKGIAVPSNNPSYIALLEICEIVKILVKSFGSIADVKNEISKMFSDKQRDGVMLSTIHKSKGLENEKVFFLYPELIPSEYAESYLEIYAEKCLFYVAVTRAKNELVYISSRKISSKNAFN
jgi:superfamily I DNA/RNA helicase